MPFSQYFRFSDDLCYFPFHLYIQYLYRNPCRIKFWGFPTKNSWDPHCYLRGKKWWVPSKSGESRTHLDELQVHLFTIQRKTWYVKIFWFYYLVDDHLYNIFNGNWCNIKNFKIELFSADTHTLFNKNVLHAFILPDYYLIHDWSIQIEIYINQKLILHLSS